MKAKTTKARRILDKNYPLLSLKDLLDQILTEEEGLPPEVLNAILQARDSAWKSFIKTHETVSNSGTKIQGKVTTPS